MRLPQIVCVVLALGACGEGEEAPRPLIFGGDRPAELEVPPTLTEGKAYPLVVVLHGYSVNGFAQAAYFGVSALPGADQALVLAPDGTPNSMGLQFWNADPACCDFEGQGPDDVAYLGGLIDDVSATWPVDRDAVYVVGHSNGGFMAYRMACERADVISAIASLAGLAASDPASCTPSAPVNVLHLHGTEDARVPFAAGGTGIGTIGAEGSITQWATNNGCAATRTAGADLDLDTSVAGSETHTSVTDGCPASGAAELWTMEGSGHIPILGPAFTPALMQWFTDHRRS